MKAFLGMGLLGSNFVRAMLQKGETVQVWNRTTSRAQALATYGAKPFEKAEEAVRNADVVHITVKDDNAVDEVLDAASAGFKQGVIVVDHTTTSAQGAIERTRYWKTKGVTYLHAPVFMGPSNALESSGYMLVSGNQALISKLEGDLSKMTGTLINLGEEEGKAAGMKLTGNSFLLSLTSGLTDALGIAKSHGIIPQEFLDLMTTWNPGAGVPGRLKKITEGNFDQPSWELKMARKDAGLMMDIAARSGVELAVIPAIAEVMDRWIEQGHGSQDWSIIAKNNL